MRLLRPCGHLICWRGCLGGGGSFLGHPITLSHCRRETIASEHSLCNTKWCNNNKNDSTNSNRATAIKPTLMTAITAVIKGNEILPAKVRGEMRTHAHTRTSLSYLFKAIEQTHHHCCVYSRQSDRTWTRQSYQSSSVKVPYTRRASSGFGVVARLGGYGGGGGGGGAWGGG